MFSKFETKEKNNDHPVAQGLLVDLLDFDDIDEKQEQIKSSIREYQKTRKFNPPYLLMDIATAENLELIVDGVEASVDEKNKNNMVKVLLSCHDIVDISNLNNEFGMKIVKTNAAVPVYRWFQAANLLLKFANVHTRVVPFPIDQENDGTTYHMLRVLPDEFQEYQKILNYGVVVEGTYKGFETAAKFSYEILKKRGITELSEKAVDHTITHVMLKSDSFLYGILIQNSNNDDFENMNNNNYIFFD